MRRACARLTVLDFTEFTLSHLPAAPRRVLEVGCGYEGGIAPALARAGYDVLAIDPEAPDGPLYRRIKVEELDDPGPFDAVVAGRVLHHVEPLGPALDKLAGLAPLLVLDEFAWNHMDEPTIEWYEERHRLLSAEGREPKGPTDLAEWRRRHSDLHTYETLRAELDARYETEVFEWQPYFHYWLDDRSTQPLEEEMIAAGAIRPIGYRYVGRIRSNRVPTAAGL
jgi:SAM-dependent methyltransferase